ncbi:MAG TPA: hypothetical protein VGK67_13240 [Myxococcales bacterium]|jgi:hypothetical protein
MKAAAPGPAISDARATADELCRQLVLEKGFAVVVPRKGGNGPPVLTDDLKRLFGAFEARLCTFPELEPLLEAADRVLVLSDGVVMDVALVRLVLDGKPLGDRLPLEKLVEVGKWFSSGSAGTSRLAVRFFVYEVHSRAWDAAWLGASRAYRRHALGQPVEVGIAAVDASTGLPWGNHAGVTRLSQAHLLRRAFLERAQTDEKRRQLLSRSGFRPVEALLAALLGSVLGISATEFLLWQLLSKGDLYAGVALVSSFVAATVSLKSCRICRAPVAQAMVAGLGAFAGIAGYSFWRALPVGWHTLVLAAIAAFAAFVIGKFGGARRPKA